MTSRLRSAAAVLSLVLVTAAPTAVAQDAAPKTPAPLPPIAPPLGRIGDVVQGVPEGGVRGREKVVTATLDRCETEQAFYLERFFTQGALGAMGQVNAWFKENPAVMKRLFGKGDLFVKTLDGARSGTFHDGGLCPKEKPQADGWRLASGAAPKALCKTEQGPRSEGGLWLFVRPGTKGALTQKDFRGAVLLSPSDPAAAKPCLPRLSAAVFDAAGKTRLRYHADWNGAAEVEVLGNGCQRLRFTFDEANRHFAPTLDAQPGCRRR